jgi:Ni,Fe-hydrogenase III large subunit
MGEPGGTTITERAAENAREDEAGPRGTRANAGGALWLTVAQHPTFVHLQTLLDLTRGGHVSDVVANIGSIDIVLGEVDR